MMYIFSCLGNIVLNKPSRQSTTLPYNDADVRASSANDGDYRRNIPGGSCSHTDDGQTTAWWQVDLESTYLISAISITPRYYGMIYVYKICVLGFRL